MDRWTNDAIVIIQHNHDQLIRTKTICNIASHRGVAKKLKIQDRRREKKKKKKKKVYIHPTHHTFKATHTYEKKKPIFLPKNIHSQKYVGEEERRDRELCSNYMKHIITPLAPL